MLLRRTNSNSRHGIAPRKLQFDEPSRSGCKVRRTFVYVCFVGFVVVYSTIVYLFKNAYLASKEIDIVVDLGEKKVVANHNPLPPSPSSSSKNGVMRMLQQAGIDDATIQQYHSQLPTDAQISDLYGTEPIIYNLESCPTFRETVPAPQRMLGPAGLFSTGTNLLTQLLKQNCEIPERRQIYGPDATKEQLGMRWQVPWGKHTPAHYRELHSTQKAADINKHDVLPVVTIRNPYTWMQSMCKNPYTAKWKHARTCPNLRMGASGSEWNPVNVKFGAGTDSYKSLVHLWNDWYKEYYQQQTAFPFLIIRMEDLVFHTQATIQQVCHCAGGQLHSNFHYITQSAKADSPGHDTSTNLVTSLIKYSHIQVMAGFTKDDYQASRDGVDATLLEAFGYWHPPSSTDERPL